MKPALLDANLLIALIWPAHQHHERAHAWFERRGRAAWATCPLTELAFVRIVSNPAFSADALNPADALALLKRNLAHPRREFWPDEVEVSEALGHAAGHLKGHRQLTDAYLLALAHRHAAVLATFDAGLRSLATGERAGALELVAPTPGSGRRA